MEMKLTLDAATCPWGVLVERVEVKDVRVPEQLQRAMAAEAEAAREARAKVIAAEGEHKASRALKHAADIITESPGALQVSLKVSVKVKTICSLSSATCRPSVTLLTRATQPSYSPSPWTSSHTSLGW